MKLIVVQANRERYYSGERKARLCHFPDARVSVERRRADIYVSHFFARPDKYNIRVRGYHRRRRGAREVRRTSAVVVVIVVHCRANESGLIACRRGRIFLMVGYIIARPTRVVTREQTARRKSPECIATRTSRESIERTWRERYFIADDTIYAMYPRHRSTRNLQQRFSFPDIDYETSGLVLIRRPSTSAVDTF